MHFQVTYCQCVSQWVTYQVTYWVQSTTGLNQEHAVAREKMLAANQQATPIVCSTLTH